MQIPDLYEISVPAPDESQRTVGRQLLELENSGATLPSVVHESVLHSQLLTTDIKNCSTVVCSVKDVERENSKSSIVSAPMLKSLPPTEYFQLNVIRAHMHCCI